MREHRRRSWSVILLCAAAVVACSTESDNRDTAAGTPASRTASESAAHDPEPLDSIPPGEIDTDWRTMSSAELRAYIQKLRYRPQGSSQTEHRDCVGEARSEKCNLLIMPVRGVRNFRPQGMSRKGAIIARIENLGTLPDSLLRITAGQFVYWLVEKQADTVRSYLLDISGARPDSVMRMTFKSCDSLPTHTAHPRSEAAFKYCRGPAPRQAGEKEGPATDHDSPPWTTCSLGCCYADTDFSGGGGG